MKELAKIVSVTNNQAVTTTAAIAEGTGNQHKAVIQLVRHNISDLEEFGRVAFQMAPFKTAGGTQNREVALLNEQQATLLITYMRNNDIVREFKKHLVKAFYEASKPKELTRLEILAMAMEAEKEKEILKIKVEQDAPKVEFHDAVVSCDDSISLGEAAKILNTGRNRLASFLRQIKWVNEKNEPYQSKINLGYVDKNISPFKHPRLGLQESITTVVKGKGLVKLQKIMSSTGSTQISLMN